MFQSLSLDQSMIWCRRVMSGFKVIMSFHRMIHEILVLFHMHSFTQRHLSGNLADNDFSGSIPSTISENNKIKLEVTGNPNLCVSGNSCTTSDTGTSSGTGSSTRISYRKKSKVPVILGTSIPAFLGFCIIVGIVAFILQKRKATSIAAVSAGQMGGQGKPNGPPQAANGHGPIGGHGQSMNNDLKVEIEQQMGAELADLMEQQAQENENGRND